MAQSAPPGFPGRPCQHSANKMYSTIAVGSGSVRYFPLLSFQSTQAAGIFVCLIFFFLTVIPYLQTVFTSIPVGIGSLKMALVALLYHVKPRSELSVNP